MSDAASVAIIAYLREHHAQRLAHEWQQPYVVEVVVVIVVGVVVVGVAVVVGVVVVRMVVVGRRSRLCSSHGRARLQHRALPGARHAHHRANVVRRAVGECE